MGTGRHCIAKKNFLFLYLGLFTFLTSDAAQTKVANAQQSEDTNQLCINEIMQSNIYTVFADMDFPDSWVELYNPTEEDINIENYFVGTSPDYHEAYKITVQETVSAGSYTLVYLDKTGNGKHADFRLNSDGAGRLYLFNDKGVLLDCVKYPAMPAPNIAYARDANDTKDWHYVIKATPNAPNTTEACDIILPPPSFSMLGHVMTESETLTISIPPNHTLPDNTHLFLSFDGKEPNASATCVEGNDTTFTIDKTTVVRARLMSPHALCPPSRTESFIFHPRSTDIPIISLVTDDAYLYSDSIGIFSRDTLEGNTKPNYAFNWRRPLNMEYLGCVGDTPLFNQLGETGMYGNSTRSSAQKSMKLIANKRFGTKHLKGRFWPQTKPKMKAVKAMCLRSCATGPRLIEGFLQNWFGMHMPNLDYQAFSPAIVYINGEYKGFMGLREKSDEDYVWANYAKLEDIEMIEQLNASQPISYARIKDNILSGTMNYDEASLYIDMNNMADMTAINIICSNTDWPYNNVSMWYPSNGSGKWRWIMKDMDMVNVAFRCSDPLTFNYLKYLTNTGEPGSQEFTMHQSSPWIWPRMKIMGKLCTMPEFRNALVDRLMVFMGDFMRWNVMLDYLEEQYEALNTEITQSLLMLKTGGRNTFKNIIQKDIDFFHTHPTVVYQHITDFYHLGSVIPMTTVNNGYPVTINDIPLTEGDFNGACFSNRSIRLNSGNNKQGWIMNVKNTNNVVTSYAFESPDINVIPIDYLSSADDISGIQFEVHPIDDITTSFEKHNQQLCRQINAIYSIDGKESTGREKTPYIIRYTDGRSKKMFRSFK